MLLFAAGCRNDTGQSSNTADPTVYPQGQALEIYAPLGEIVQKSDVGLKVVCRDKEVYDQFTDFVFSVEKKYWGDAEDIIRLRMYHANTAVIQDGRVKYEYGFSEDGFESGKVYFLAAEKRSSLLYEYNHIYVINGGLTISLSDGTVRLYGEEQAIQKEKVTENYFLKLYEEVPHEKESEPVSTNVYTDNFEEMWNESEYVVRIRLTDVVYDGPATATTTFYAEVLEQYNGNRINTDRSENNQILVALLKDSTAVSGEYIVGISGISKGDPDTLVFIQETRYSVYPVDDEILDRIREAKNGI